MWKIDPNINISIITYIQDIYIYLQKIFPIVGLLEETRGGGKEEDNDRE
jgi:hypothetical protein